MPRPKFQARDEKKNTEPDYPHAMAEPPTNGHQFRFPAFGSLRGRPSYTCPKPEFARSLGRKGWTTERRSLRRRGEDVPARRAERAQARDHRAHRRAGAARHLPRVDSLEGPGARAGLCTG